MPARTDTKPPGDGDEKAVLRAFLDQLRAAVAAKAEGVDEPAVRTGGVPSGTSLLGLVKHLTAVEGFYFLGAAVGDWQATHRPRPEETAEGLVASYRDAVAAANRVIDGWDGLTEPGPARPGRGPSPSRRWLLVHMIEETGRHAGHADILREQIDGATGR